MERSEINNTLTQRQGHRVTEKLRKNPTREVGFSSHHLRHEVSQWPFPPCYLQSSYTSTKT